MGLPYYMYERRRQWRISGSVTDGHFHPIVHIHPRRLFPSNRQVVMLSCYHADSTIPIRPCNPHWLARLGCSRVEDHFKFIPISSPLLHPTILNPSSHHLTIHSPHSSTFMCLMNPIPHRRKLWPPSNWLEMLQIPDTPPKLPELI